MTLDHRLSEATLTRLWADQRFPPSAFVTRQGRAVRVLHPGRRGRGAGPDFRDALIATPGSGLLRGDVELHVRASDFRAHGHQRDPRYNDVVLHVVFEDDVGEDTPLASGQRAAVVALAPWVRQRRQELATWLSRPKRWREPCHDALRLGRARLLHTLEALGDERFHERTTSLADAVRAQGPGEALYQALLAALGYGGERRLEELPERLPWRELAARLSSAAEGIRPGLAEALLLGTGGLLASQQGRELRHPWEQALELHWLFSGLTTISSRGASGAPSRRPANHPARRLAGLARLLARHSALLEGTAPPDELLTDPVPRIIAAWTVPAAGYWQRHLTPGVDTSRALGALIGRGRAIELLVNAVLPWAAALARQSGDHEATARARACFARLPRPGPYGALAFLEAHLGAASGPLPLDARRQQGLLRLYKTACTQGGCGRCPLS